MATNESLIYSELKIGNLTAKNRIIRSATFEFGASDGKVTPALVELYRKLAEGGSGVIVTGQIGVSAGGRTAPIMMETTYDGFVDDFKKITDEVHKNGSLLFVQLNHCGYKTSKLPGYDDLGVSDLTMDDRTFHQATRDEIKKIASDFGLAAKRCREANCDGVQIHACHGYLLNTFLSPYFNRRTDEYGGPIENRARIVFEVYEQIRTNVGAAYPIGIKIPCSDLAEPSITVEDCIYVCKELEKRGIDLAEISSGITPTGPSSYSPLADADNQGHFLSGAEQIAKSLKVPVASVGGYRTPEFIEKTLAETSLAAISLCRPLIREPNLVNRWKSDRSEASCVSCNKCFKSQGIVSCLRQKQQYSQ
jgi:2,4-dienoyl-CoA reductase-like NADH-dependent reductase (Old Yellow Enzyme family)